ncbi:MAG: acetyl-CoA carboxylase biotin carboxyl carrier protein subunit [Anaerolineales bacterium]
MKYLATIGDRTFEIEINAEGQILADGQLLAVDFQSVADQPVYSLLLDGESFEANVSSAEQHIEVLLRGHLFVVTVEDERQRRLRESTSGGPIQEGEYNLTAPMPGLVVAIPVGEGQEVEQGQNLVILESMKMQNELKAPRPGTVERIRVGPGDSVEQNQVLLSLT